MKQHSDLQQWYIIKSELPQSSSPSIVDGFSVGGGGVSVSCGSDGGGGGGGEDGGGDEASDGGGGAAVKTMFGNPV